MTYLNAFLMYFTLKSDQCCDFSTSGQITREIFFIWMGLDGSHLLPYFIGYVIFYVWSEV
eukprot:TRINITY_DN16154_c0_g1_i1.p1 TRINITY_DN16154_c0_g1~~TRINITY_DN16154_c0_g1_i1.p1  ORF type:complete len:60 (+),score=1.92 TRINITY_DN16154_c0_g1_i1:112-291(+)